MKYFLFVSLLVIAVGSFAQSKKEQIELLQHQLDSISEANRMLLVNRHEVEKLNRKTISELTREAEMLRRITKTHIYEIDSLLSRVNELEKENSILKREKSRIEVKDSGNVNSTNSKSEQNSVQGRNLNLGREPGIRTSRERLTNVNVDHIEINEDAKITYNLTVDSNGSVAAFECVSTATSSNDLELIDKIGVSIQEQVKYAKRLNTPSEHKLFEVNIKANGSHKTTNSRNNSSNPFGSRETTLGFGNDSGTGTGSSQGIRNSGIRTRLNNVRVDDIKITKDATIYYKLTIDEYGIVRGFSHLISKTTTTDLILINKIGVAIKKQVKYNKAPGAPLVYQFYTIHLRPS